MILHALIENYAKKNDCQFCWPAWYAFIKRLQIYFVGTTNKLGIWGV